MLEQFWAWMRAIEKEFGKNFLETKPDHELRPSGKAQHPVRYHWRHARNFLTGLRPDQRDLCNESLAYIKTLAITIEVVRDFQGFNSEIRPKLKDWNTFDAAYYEMHIAAHVSRFGNVEFIVTKEGIRTPDLRVSRDNESVIVECRRKERLPVTLLPPDMRSRLQPHLSRLLEAAPGGLDVLIVVLGAEPSVIVQAVADAEETIASGIRGIYPNTKIGAALVIQDLVPASPSLHGSEQRQAEPQGQTRIRVQSLLSHRFNSILATFTEKRQRRQISKNDIGVFCFDLDLTQVQPEYWRWYLEVVGALLQQRVWHGGSNTRIKGIMLTSPGWYRADTVNGWRTPSDLVLSYIIKSGPDSLPGWFDPNPSDDWFQSMPPQSSLLFPNQTPNRPSVHA